MEPACLLHTVVEAREYHVNEKFLYAINWYESVRLSFLSQIYSAVIQLIFCYFIRKESWAAFSNAYHFPKLFS